MADVWRRHAHRALVNLVLQMATGRVIHTAACAFDAMDDVCGANDSHEKWGSRQRSIAANRRKPRRNKDLA